MAFENLQINIGEDQVAELMLNRPRQLNTFNTPMATELVQALRQLDENPQARVIVLKGAGKAFCAGIDIHEFFDKSANEYRAWVERMEAPLVEIARRAYYIAERRRKLSLPGDELSDWIEAEKQLRKEGSKKSR